MNEELTADDNTKDWKTLDIQHKLEKLWQTSGIAGDTIYGEFAEIVAQEYAKAKTEDERNANQNLSRSNNALRDSNTGLRNKNSKLQKEVKRLTLIEHEVVKVWAEDGDNGEIQMKTPIAWYRVLRLINKELLKTKEG